MPFFRRKDSEDGPSSSKSNGNGTAASKEKVNYKARLEHKMYLVCLFNLNLPPVLL